MRAIVLVNLTGSYPVEAGSIPAPAKFMGYAIFWFALFAVIYFTVDELFKDGGKQA